MRGSVARHATTHVNDGHGGGAGNAMLASKIPFWPAAIVKTRVPESSVLAPAGSVGNAGIGGSDPTGRADALGDALRGGVAVADAVAAGVGVGALVVVALADAGGVALRDADEPGTFRSVSTPHAIRPAARMSGATDGRLRG